MAMEKSNSEIYYIDRSNFNKIQNKNMNINDILDIFCDYPNTKEICDKISPITKSFIININKILNKSFFSNYLCTYSDNFLSSTDLKYIEYSSKKYLEGELSNVVEASPSIRIDEDIQFPKKYYEIIPLVNATGLNLLVVIEEGFFFNLTKCKDELLKFILDSLSYQYKWNAFLKHLLRVYLSVKVNDGEFDLIKLRFENSGQ